MTNSIASMFLVLALAAFGGGSGTARVGNLALPAPTPAPAASELGTVKEFLLTSATSDFHEHPPTPVRLRAVRLGHLVGSNGEVSYRLCGQFVTAGQTMQWL